ncbi:MAG: hypothetical protein FJ170_03860 [Gammaproteobacteria bacterium]|nr:hypothetical protein [Gammaproteobacteria bacterium]
MADRSGEGGRTAGAIDGGVSGEDLPFGIDNQSAEARVEGCRCGTASNQGIATMSGMQAQFAAVGIPFCGVANKMADRGNLQDDQQECGEQDAEPRGYCMAAGARTVRPDDHWRLIPVMTAGCKQHRHPR